MLCFFGWELKVQGPILQSTQTHLHISLGDDNVLLVKFADNESAMNSRTSAEEANDLYGKFGKEGINVGLRLYRFFVLRMKKNDSAIGNNPYKDVTNDKTSALQRVPSKSSGEGLPYAPEGWPNAGDVWERGSKDFHLEILPTDSLSPRHDSRILEFSSRKGVIKYLESKFPNMSPKDFFAMFTWLIPSAEQTPTQG